MDHTPSLSDDYLCWHEQMMDVFNNRLTQAEKDELASWEREHVTGDGQFGTSDWPGWKKYIGIPPAKLRSN